MKGIYSPENESSGAKDVWEMRPGGMLVQKRDPDADHHRVPPPPTIRVRVKHGSVYHEINISSQASFGMFSRLQFFIFYFLQFCCDFLIFDCCEFVIV